MQAFMADTVMDGDGWYDFDSILTGGLEAMTLDLATCRRIRNSRGAIRMRTLIELGAGVLFLGIAALGGLPLSIGHGPTDSIIGMTAYSIPI
jgi:hypothetical protein